MAVPGSSGGAERAAEIFLKRRLFRRVRDGALIAPGFAELHYPCYWHYDVLFGLKVLAEAGFIADERCGEALDLLESKRLPDGGFPAERKYYRVSRELSLKRVSGHSTVGWGGAHKRRANQFVTLDALFVLQRAGRA